METDRNEQNKHAKLEKPFVVIDLDQIYFVITVLFYIEIISILQGIKNHFVITRGAKQGG